MNLPSVVLLIVAGFLVGAGVYLILERTLTRIFIGLSLMTHGVNVLLLASGGSAGRPPLLGAENPSTMADPLPQAMMLTSIVLSVGTTAFGLALAYRQWRLTGHDEVVDDLEDRWLARRAAEEPISNEAVTGDEDADINYDNDGEDESSNPHTNATRKRHSSSPTVNEESRQTTGGEIREAQHAAPHTLDAHHLRGTDSEDRGFSGERERNSDD